MSRPEKGKNKNLPKSNRKGQRTGRTDRYGVSSLRRKENRNSSTVPESPSASQDGARGRRRPLTQNGTDKEWPVSDSRDFGADAHDCKNESSCP